jgi:hypothetical protein
MNNVMKMTVGVLTLMMMALVFGTSQLALAHGETQVEGYDIEIGWHIEPAYQGAPNGLDLFVHNSETGEPVNGLEKTLQVELIYGSQNRELEIYPQFEQDGAYTADVIPTRAGDYTWHVWGAIEGHAVDFEMTSGPDTFEPVVSRTDASFPEAEPSTSEAVQSAQTATLIGAAGVLFGMVGIVLGVIGMRKKS